jgi:signal transduction histidine kinase/ligand-binding sensor domain-containing protein
MFSIKLRNLLFACLLAFSLSWLALNLQAKAAPPIQTGGSNPYNVSILRFYSFGHEEGLSQNTVYAILQDRQDFMWFGTEGGLNKFDGYQFTVYKHNPDDPTTISDNFVRAIHEDKSGDLWVGTRRGLDRFDRRTGIFVHYTYTPDAQSSGFAGVLAIYEDSNGNLWAGTEGEGLLRLDPERNSIQTYLHNPRNPASLANNTVRVIFEDSGGALWFGTDDGLDRLDPDTGIFHHYKRDPRNPSSLNGSKVQAIYEDSHGSLWVGTDGGGLDQLEPETETFIHYKHGPRNPLTLSSNTVTSILEDSTGRLFIGTGGGGLSHLDQSHGRFFHYRHHPDREDSLCSDLVQAIYEDRSGGIWIGTAGGGLCKSNQTVGKFPLYRNDPRRTSTLNDNYIWAVAEDSQGYFWVGTRRGGLNRLNPHLDAVGVYRHSPVNPGSISSNDVRTLLHDSQGSLWAGTVDQGLNRLDPGSDSFIHFRYSPTDANSLSSDAVRVLFEDRQGNVWVGTENAGLNRFDPETQSFTRYLNDPDDPQSLIHNRVTAITQDEADRLWIGTWGGISILLPNEDQFTHFRREPGRTDGLSSAFISSFHEDDHGAMWIATYGGGLNRYDLATHSFSHYIEADGLASNQIFGILPDDTGKLWLSTNNGLSHFDPAAETFRNYDEQDGLQSAEFSPGAYSKSSNGLMLFGGVEGLNAFDPNQVQDNPYIPTVVITSFSKFNQVIQTDLANGESYELSYRDNFISFEFASLDFAAPDKNQYAYMLEGLEDDWNYAGTRRYASYTNLSGGEYIFRVKGSNSDGVWNEIGTAVRIKIIPPFWLTSWFMLLMAGLSVGSVAVVYRLRVRSYRIQNERLEQQVNERTAEIERRREVAEGLREIINILNSNSPLDEILSFIIDQTVRLLGSDAVAIYRYHAREGVLTIQSARGLREEYTENLVIPLGEGISGRAVQTRRPVSISGEEILQLKSSHNNGNKNEQHNLMQLILKEYQSFLSLPLLVKDEVYGALTLFNYQSRELSPEEIGLAVGIADQAALALETARLRDQARQVAVAGERNRLARELHDAVTQTLFSASLIADVLPRIWERSPEEGKRRLEELRQFNRGALAEMRSLLLELRPTALVEADIRELFRHLTDAFGGRSRIPIEYKIEGDCHLPPDVKVAFYRIAQESLNNVVKHARASRVSIDIHCLDDQIAMCVCDDGRGFDPDSVTAEHLGLKIMRERAENIGAILTVNSQAGHGTQLVLTWQEKAEEE